MGEGDEWASKPVLKAVEKRKVLPPVGFET
jgi:hypothetical protein